jgi:hypothetical protein
MRRNALEEAFWPQGPRTRGASTDNITCMRSDVARRWKQRLGDFTEYRLAEMDRFGIDMPGSAARHTISPVAPPRSPTAQREEPAAWT